MNVLMFTMTMIILLATMTYAKIDSFRTLQISEKEFQSYIEKTERKIINNEADIWYKSIVVNPQGSNTPGTPKPPRVGTSKFSWSVILDADERDKDPQKLKQVIELTKKLIFNLFSEQKTFNTMIEANPDILDRLFSSLINTIDKLPGDRKIKKIIELSSLDLQNEELNLLLYELIKENPHNTIPKDNKQLKRNKDSYSLLDQLTTEPKPTRLYLASRALLTSIFNQDSGLADQVIIKRQTLYNQVKGGMDIGEANAEFEAFIKSIFPYINPKLFNYSVTKTDPKKYE